MPGLHDADERPVGDGDDRDERPGDDAAGDHRGDDVLEGHASGGEDVEEHDAFIGEEVLIEPVLEGVEQGQRVDAHLDAEFAERRGEGHGRREGGQEQVGDHAREVGAEHAERGGQFLEERDDG